MSLPKYWCVKNDGSQRFRDSVIKYLNTIDLKKRWTGRNQTWYYGYDGNVHSNYNGSNCHSSIYQFSNIVTQLSLDEFERLLNEKQVENYQIC